MEFWKIGNKYRMEKWFHETFRYTRNLVDTRKWEIYPNDFVLGRGVMVVAYTIIDAKCFVKVLDGTLRETLVAWPENLEE